MPEPRTWTLPEEPPVGTVVGAMNSDQLCRWKSTSPDHWMLIQSLVGLPVEASAEDTSATWNYVLELCGGTAREYPNPADPDGRQSELDKLRAENEQLRAELIDVAENLTQAEKDRDDANENARIAGELLGQEQNNRAAAQREANRLKQVLESVGRAARQAVES